MRTEVPSEFVGQERRDRQCGGSRQHAFGAYAVEGSRRVARLNHRLVVRRGLRRRMDCSGLRPRLEVLLLARLLNTSPHRARASTSFLGTRR